MKKTIFLAGGCFGEHRNTWIRSKAYARQKSVLQTATQSILPMRKFVTTTPDMPKQSA